MESIGGFIINDVGADGNSLSYAGRSALVCVIIGGANSVDHINL
jgi:hypothetical protein